ncbi:MAG: CAF17-like 4Fe-4S cluster assembly/insertion protein YgfZ [Anaerolineales bacterium]
MGSNELNISNDYRAALEGAAFYPQTEAGMLRLRDQDRMGFLQRQTTNELGGLAAGRSVLTVLVSPTARILDVLRVFMEGDEVLALTLPGHGENTFNYLRRRIFFNDRVHLEDASQQFSQIDLEGPRLRQVMQKLGFERAPEVDEVLEADWQDSALKAIGQRGLMGLGVRLIVPAAVAVSVNETLLSGDAEELSRESREILRLEAGLPASPTELSEAYTPLEVGLDYAVSGDKGCYPGQEVIARQITYDKVTRKLVGLKLETPVQPGTRLLAEGAPVGEITSAAVSPRFGAIALGMVKRPHFEAGTRLQLEVDGAVHAVVENLPRTEIQQ